MIVPCAGMVSVTSAAGERDESDRLVVTRECPRPDRHEPRARQREARRALAVSVANSLRQRAVRSQPDRRSPAFTSATSAPAIAATSVIASVQESPPLDRMTASADSGASPINSDYELSNGVSSTNNTHHRMMWRRLHVTDLQLQLGWIRNHRPHRRTSVQLGLESRAGNAEPARRLALVAVATLDHVAHDIAFKMLASQ